MPRPILATIHTGAFEELRVEDFVNKEQEMMDNILSGCCVQSE